MNETLFIALGIFAVSFALVLKLKSKIGSKFEIKSPDIVLALIPVLLWTMFAGKLSKFEIGGIVSVESAFTQASQAPVAAQISTVAGLPVNSIAIDPKGGFEDIPRLIEKKSQALLFQLGEVSYQYSGGAILQYVELLTQHPYLRWLVIVDSDGKFVGMLDARGFNQLAHASQNSLDVYQFAEWLNQSQKVQLETLPGFIAASQAVRKSSSRAAALAYMDSIDVDTLPAVDDSGRFIGIVDRSRLTASMLLEVAGSLGKAV